MIRIYRAPLPAVSRWTLGAVAILLVSGWLAVLWVDVFNLGGVQSVMMARGAGSPLLWYDLFSEGRTAENLQWLLLGTLVLVLGRLMFQARRAGRERDAQLLLALTFGAALMLVEDSLNFRHIVADHWLPALLSDGEGPSRTMRMAWELVFYSGLATLMLLPLPLLLRGVQLARSAGVLLVIAYGVYGLVGFGSAMRRLGDWQARLGEWVIAHTGLGEIPSWAYANGLLEARAAADPTFELTLGYLLVDHLFEESVELAAAGLLLAAFLGLRADLVAAWQSALPEGDAIDRPDPVRGVAGDPENVRHGV